MQARKILICALLRIFCAHRLPLLCSAFAQQKQKPCFLPGLKRDVLFQTAAVIAAFHKGSPALSALNHLRIALRAVRSDEGIPHAVKSVRCEIRCKKLIAILLIVKVVNNHSILIGRAGRIQAHLKVLIVHRNLVKTEFKIGKHRKMARASGVIAQAYVYDFHRIIHGCVKLLPG